MRVTRTTAYLKFKLPDGTPAPRAASDTESLDLQPLTDESTQVASASTEETTMPSTASWTYTFGLAGALLLAMASLLTFMRRLPRHRMK